MDFSQVKAITIPEGSVNRILSGATVLWEKTGGLPTEYQQVEYIESTGTQYLNIPYTPVENDEFDVVATATSLPGYSTLISCGTGDYQFIILLQRGGGFYKYFATGAAPRFDSSAVNVNVKVRYTNKGHVEQLVVTNADTGVEISSCYSSYQQAIDGTDKTLYVLKRANNTSPFRGRLYKLTIDNGNTKKLNLVPCYRKSDGVAGLYDMVNNVFYTNAGTGEFTVGPKVFPLPSGYQQVEYIESTGTQCIDTGVIGKTGLHIVAEMGYATPGRGLFGCRYGETRFFVVLWPSPYFSFGYGGDIATEIKVENRKIYNIDFDTSTHPKRFGIDGVYKTSSEHHDAPVSIYIFCYNFNRPTSFSNAIFKSMTITDENGGLLRKFVPCYRIADGEIGLYDLVSATFFTNSGSGTFIKGADIT